MGIIHRQTMHTVSPDTCQLAMAVWMAICQCGSFTAADPGTGTYFIGDYQGLDLSLQNHGHYSQKASCRVSEWINTSNLVLKHFSEFYGQSVVVQLAMAVWMACQRVVCTGA